jgi:hypothetical protein
VTVTTVLDRQPGASDARGERGVPGAYTAGSRVREAAVVRAAVDRQPAASDAGGERGVAGVHTNRPCPVEWWK